MFRSPFVALFREAIYEGYITKTTKPMSKYKIWDGLLAFVTYPL